MATKTEIVNRALGKLGSLRVTNIDTDNSEEAKTANTFYDSSLESILSDDLWTFATKRALLSKLDETIAFNRTNEGIEYIYQYPVDCIRIFDVSVSGAYWKREGDTIVSDIDSLGIIYVYRNTNPATYPPKFIEAFADKLAYELAFNLLNLPSTKLEQLNRVYEGISLPAAKAVNAQEGVIGRVKDDYWANAKWTGAINIEHPY